MKKQILTVVLSSTLLLSGCANWCDECADGSCEVVTSQVVLPTSALFAFDSAKLTMADNQALATVVERLKAEPEEKVEIVSNKATDPLNTPVTAGTLFTLGLFGKKKNEE